MKKSKWIKTKNRLAKIVDNIASARVEEKLTGKPSEELDEAILKLISFMEET